MNHSATTMNPSGGVAGQRGVTKPSLHEDLMARVMDRANLQRAWRRVKANGGAPGVDGMTVEEFPAYMRTHWPVIRTAVLEGSYQPSPVRRKSIPKPGGRFLGFTFRGSKLCWSDRSFADFKHRLRRLTGRSWGVSMEYRFYKLAQYLRGWMAYFGISDHYRPVPELDHWIRRRIRMCYWKQWRRVRTKVRNLLALGTRKREAILTAISRKSYWHLSKSLATQTGMTNAWLASQGLLSVLDLWPKAHGYVGESSGAPLS